MRILKFSHLLYCVFKFKFPVFSENSFKFWTIPTLIYVVALLKTTLTLRMNQQWPLFSRRREAPRTTASNLKGQTKNGRGLVILKFKTAHDMILYHCRQPPRKNAHKFHYGETSSLSWRYRNQVHFGRSSEGKMCYNSMFGPFGTYI